MPIESFVTTASHFPVSHLIEPFFWWLEQSWHLFALLQHATGFVNKFKITLTLSLHLNVTGRSPQRHASLPTYYKVLLQYYSVLQSTIPVLLCTTKYYSSTTLYYSSTSLYYKVLLQYYSVLQSTTPVPVVPHEAVAEVSRIGHYRRDWLLWVTDGRAKTLMDWTVQVSRWLIDELTNWLID